MNSCMHHFYLKSLCQEIFDLSDYSYQGFIQRYDISKGMAIYELNLLEYRHIGIHLKALDEQNPNMSTLLS